jgi:hypothetical protein
VTGAEWTAIGVALVAIAGNVVLFIMGALKEKDLREADARQSESLERLKSDLAASAAKRQRFETIQQDAILELYEHFHKAIETTELFSGDYGIAFKNSDGHDAKYLIGVDWGGAFRKLRERGILFDPALVTAMQSVLDTIEEIQSAVRRENSVSHGRRAAGLEAVRLVSDVLKPKWKAVLDDLQRLLGVETRLEQGGRL